MNISDITPAIIGYALVGGVIPTFLWLFFWLRQTKQEEPRGLVALAFFIGLLVVPITIPIQHVAHDLWGMGEWFFFVVAGIEELGKFLLLRMIVLRTDLIRFPSDYTVYMITGALGFAALENTLYLLQPLVADNIPLAINAMNMRFLGSTVIHAASSAAYGLWLGLAYCNTGIRRLFIASIGLTTAVALHGIFNYFIIDDSKYVVWLTIGTTWLVMVGIIIAVRNASRVRQCPPP